MRGSAGQEICPWDLREEESEDEEDWLFSSVRQYQQLHMFQLSVSPSHLALSPDGHHLALADSGRGQLEVYRLPGKLVAASEEEEGLTSNRDFALVCGTVKCPAVRSLHCVGRRRLVTTSSDCQAVSVWRWEAGEDLLERTGEVSTGQFQPRAVEVLGQDRLLVWGENWLARADMEGRGLDRREVGGGGGEEIQTVMTEASVTWYLDTRGDLSSLDWRQSDSVLHHNIHQGRKDRSLSQSCFFKRGSNTFLAGHGDQTLALWDLRNCQPVQEVSLASPGAHIVTDSEGNIVLSQGSRVSLYSSDSLQLVFSHETHRADISCLLAHPAVRNLVISADSNSRLQAWVHNSPALT